MTNAERMRAAAAKRSQKATAPDVPPPAPPPAPEPKPTVRMACGCDVPVASFKSSFCPACREKARQARHERNRERWAREKADALARPNPDRLPAGAVFGPLTWDGTHWTGTLTIGTQTFTSTATGVFRLLKNLDALYRQTQE